jgi:hypothetical protein
MYFDVKVEISCLMIFSFCIYSLLSIIIIIIAQVGAETNKYIIIIIIMAQVGAETNKHIIKIIILLYV